MDIILYTSPGCTWCDKMKELMKRATVEYKEICYVEMTELERGEFRAAYPTTESLPVAIIDGEYVGGWLK